jgi:diguanylate cyclase (GGDEF)-like protein
MDHFTNKQTPFTLCLLDIKNFYAINNEYGSHAGDMLLKHLSTLLTNAFNENIFVSRIFADSFALLFSEEDKNFLQKHMVTIEKKIEQNPLRYTQDDIISFRCRLCFEHYDSNYSNAKLFLEHLQNNMKRKKIDEKLTC